MIVDDYDDDDVDGEGSILIVVFVTNNENSIFTSILVSTIVRFAEGKQKAHPEKGRVRWNKIRDGI